ncbi:MAG: cobalamin biosynthesis protein CobQ [Fischerella sp. CENA71]|nr:cobalamin biosynthesis protein CobQ [Fischerella sp. CENA71]
MHSRINSFSNSTAETEERITGDDVEVELNNSEVELEIESTQNEQIEPTLLIEAELSVTKEPTSSNESISNGDDKKNLDEPIEPASLTKVDLSVKKELASGKVIPTSIKQSTTIHLVDGEKGGCGKSFLSRAFIEYCISIGLDTAIVDADISNKDISKIYSGVETAFFSDDEKQAQQADKIFDLAFEKSVIVNLPAQVYTNVTQWIQRNDLIELGKENSITFVKWFVCTGGVDSVNFFLESLEDLGNQMLHVFVRNWGMCDDWKYIDEMPEFIAAKTKYNFTVMDLPKFPFWERNQVDRLGATFEDALAHHELGVVSKQRVKNFLKQAYAAFKETGLVK